MRHEHAVLHKFADSASLMCRSLQLSYKLSQLSQLV